MIGAAISVASPEVEPLRLAEQAFTHDPGPQLARRLGQSGLVPLEQVATRAVIVSPGYLSGLRALAPLLDAALRGVVDRYFHDQRIRDIYRLPEALEAILRLAARQPYQLGFCRPDFVYDRSGQARICEIGARYPMNGWMITHHFVEACAAQAAGLGLRLQREHGTFLDILEKLHPVGARVAIVHAAEQGGEIFCMARALESRGIRFIHAHPSSLQLRGGRLYAEAQPIDRCILEMDRSELALIPEQALRALICEVPYFNDVRTLILIHDKRVLAVLHDADIMRDVLGEADYRILRRYLIPTWVLANTSECERMLARDGEMIVKRSSGGRGVDTLVRSAVSADQWRQRILQDRALDMYQEYVDQCELHEPGLRRDIKLVGAQLLFNGRHLGAAVFRGSDEPVINVHQNRGNLYPAMVAA